MRAFELNIFIDRPERVIYEHMAEPINMIGLQPRLTTIDVLQEQKDAKGVVLRPFHIMETYRWGGLPFFRNRLYMVLHLTKPYDLLEAHVYSWPDIHIVYNYTFYEAEGNRTHLVQKVDFEQVSRMLESIVFDQAIKTQRAFLTNLKVRLEKL
jgi:hypothetical protein